MVVKSRVTIAFCTSSTSSAASTVMSGMSASPKTSEIFCKSSFSTLAHRRAASIFSHCAMTSAVGRSADK